MREYRMYVLFFILCDWGKRFTEAHSPHYAVLPLGSNPAILRFRSGYPDPFLYFYARPIIY